MTDLSTTNLKHLLDKATPGPWKHDDEVGEILGAYYEKNGIGYIPTVGYADDYNADLIALAPQLAEEVLRLRKELTNLQAEARYAELFHATELTAKQVFEALDTTISEILGDHDA